MTVAFFAAAFVYLYCTVFLLPATPIFFESDHFIPMYDSVRMLGGQVLYKDFFQFTFPGTQVWYVALFAAFGERIWLLNATIILLGMSIAAAMFAISRRLMSGVYAYIPSAVFLFFGFRWYGMDGGHRLFSCLFATLAIAVLIDKVTRSRLMLAGLFCALSAYFTQNRGVGIAAAIAVFLVWEVLASERRDHLKGLVVSLAVFGGAFTVTLLAMTAYFLISVGVQTFVESTLLFASSYNADPLNNSDLYMQFWRGLFSGNVAPASLPVDLFYYLLVPAVYVVPLIYYVIKRPAERELWRKVMLLSISGMMMFLVTTGLNAVRLYHVAIPGIILLVLWFYRSALRPVALAGTGVMVAMAIALWVWGQVKQYSHPADLPTGTVVFTSEMAGERYSWLNDHTEPGDLVFEPFRTVVNFPLRVKNPTSFAMLRSNDYTPPEHVAMVVKELEARAPKYILWDGNWSLEPGERRADDHLGPLYDFLRTNYRLNVSLTPIYEFKVEVWERNSR